MCYNTLATKYVVFVTTFPDWYCLKPSKEQAAPIRASAKDCIFFALQAALFQEEKYLCASYLQSVHFT